LNKSLGQINQCLDQKKFSEAMQGLAYLCPIINEFFNQVKVNNSNTFIRINRLKLLSQIKIVLEQVADFSKIDVSK
jgi:glycyl-tRNA synthetase beta chain